MDTDISASSLGYYFKSELKMYKPPAAETETWP